jgi:hypothetical protein
MGELYAWGSFTTKGNCVTVVLVPPVFERQSFMTLLNYIYYRNTHVIVAFSEGMQLLFTL